MRTRYDMSKDLHRLFQLNFLRHIIDFCKYNWPETITYVNKAVILEYNDSLDLIMLRPDKNDNTKVHMMLYLEKPYKIISNTKMQHIGSSPETYEILLKDYNILQVMMSYASNIVNFS